MQTQDVTVPKPRSRKQNAELKSVVARRGISLNEAARIAGVSRPLLYKQSKLGLLELRKIGCRTIVMSDELERWLNSAPVVEHDSAA